MKRKWLITYDDVGAERLIDKTDAEAKTRTFKLKADKRDERWTDAWRGVELARVVDDGNGYSVTLKGREPFCLDVCEAAHLLTLLQHIDETSNAFCDGIKTEIK